MKKINFKQGKYILPAVSLLPLLFVIYEVTSLAGNSTSDNKGNSDSLNTELPEANTKEMQGKLAEMSKIWDDEENHTAIDALGEEEKEKAEDSNAYDESELNKIDADRAAREEQQKRVDDLERRLAESRKHINRYSNGNSSSVGGGNNQEVDDYLKEIEGIQRRSQERQKMIEKQFGINRDDDSPETNTSSRPQVKQDKEKPALVVKSEKTNESKFNTIRDGISDEKSPLIRAMIDKTTKAKDGTRIRFKLLDDVTVKGNHLKKGTYLYGIVSGFGQQRVKANITSILANNSFIKINLAVYDNDGMEGFYVPESEFREFVKDASSSAANQQISFNNGGYGSEISGEAIALQALQNVYQSASSAVSKAIKKNRATIKYNTIVYLINDQEAR